MTTPTPTKLNMTKGLIARPPVLQRIATRKIENVGMNRIGPRAPRGICWHRGLTGEQTFEGAVEYLTRPDTAGLTDAYISHVSGQMARMTPPFGGADDMTPWAQGPWNEWAASSDAKAFVARYQAGSGKGVSVWNSDLFSIEITGDYFTPISEACKRTMVQFTAAFSQEIGVRWDQYPLNTEGISTLYSHREGCGEAYKLCGGEVVWTYINSAAFLNAVKALLKAAQTGGKAIVAPTPSTPAPAPTPTEEYAPLIQPAFLKSDGLPLVDKDGTRYFQVRDQIRAKRETPRLQTANVTKAKHVGPMVRKGEDANASFIFTSAEDGKAYYLSSYGTCLLVDDFDVTSDLPAKA